MRTAVFLCALNLVLTLVLLSACAPAQAAPALFDEYELGAPKSELLARPGMKPGEGSMAGDLILPGVSWAGCEWTAQFGFEREKLTTVTLLAVTGANASMPSDGIFPEKALKFWELSWMKRRWICSP